MQYVFLIFLSTFSLNENVLGNSCENDNCTSAIGIPLITHLNAPLKAELDISILTEQLKELIGHEVKQTVSTAMKDLAENIVDKRAEIALDNLKTYNNLSISTFQKDIEVAMTAHPSSQRTIGYAIIKFDNIKYSVGITNISTNKTTGKFTCEHEGLYLISASVRSNTNNAHYYIILNGNDISYTYIGEHSGSKAFTGAVTVTTKLNPNDQVWLYAYGSWFIYSGLWSKLTIIKIK